MRKPSMFSSDYNRKMKKRRIIIWIITISIIVIMSVVINFVRTNVNFGHIRTKMQAWIDGGDNRLVDNEKSEDKTIPNANIQEEIKEPELKLIELSISEGKIAKVEYEEIDGQKKIKNVNYMPENIYYSISPSKNLILTIDESQNLKVYNVNGEVLDLTNSKYSAKNGDVYTKDWALGNNKDYIWCKDAKFIDDEKIAYISNIPYFGMVLDKYVWIVDVKNKNHITLWNLKGKDAKLGNVDDKGLEATVNGTTKHVNSSGNIIN